MKYLANAPKLDYDLLKCTGCRRCVEVCPRGVFEMNEKRARITDRDRCIECGACAGNCAYGAIRVESGVGCAAAFIHAMVYGGEPTCDCSSNGGDSGCC